ncbi:MAG: DUF4292 domain-containing protein [Muribaculaceae bacterium]|nr:DUF4292 domain-containing protein [Muribaculaceae bacterium]
MKIEQMKPEKLTALLLTIIVALASAGCKSHKKNVETTLQPVAETEQAATWRNIYAPVAVDILQPAQFSTSGRMTMVRGESIYLSLRMFGMEVGSAFADNDRAVLAMRMPKKMVMELPVVEMLRRGGMTLADVQDALLGDPGALARLPEAVSCNADVDDRKAVVEFHATYAGKPLGLRLTWSLDKAEWDAASPRQWSEPGSDYTRVTPSQALKMLGGIL